MNFRGVLAGCMAAIVAAAPIEGMLTAQGVGMARDTVKRPFLESDEYAAATKILPFCRLWCVHATPP